MNRRTFTALAAGTVAALGLGRIGKAADGVTRVACVGDSITFGSGTKTPKTDSYPAQLGRMLGEKYGVSNFGVSATTLLKQSDHPYQNTGAMRRCVYSNPDIVVIMLGTNDTKPQNWKHKDQFVADYKDLIGQFKKLDSHPKIFICLPPCVPGEGNYGINEAGVEEQLPLIKQVVADEGVGVIDNHAPLVDHPDLLPDRVHPNNDGATLLARTVYAGIVGKAFVGEVPSTRKAD